MDTPRRILAKAISWQCCGLVSMLFIGLIFTGSFAAGSVLALVSALTGFALYCLHEMLWARVGWGRGSQNRSVG